MTHNISKKTNRILNIILLGLLLILIRVWYLAAIERDVHAQRARKPQRRTQIEHVERATIRDRFNLPFAMNKMQYNAAVCYADLREIPYTKWGKNAQGKRVRIQERMRYIQQLSLLLGQELKMAPEKIEDIIHSKASLFPHTLFTLKENLTEKEYYRLKLLEKDWLGICAQRSSTRYYPKRKVGSDVIGFLGAISLKEYYNIAQELVLLQTYFSQRELGNTPILPKGFGNAFQVKERLQQLQEKAYTINDCIGKTGVESFFDPELRGYAGKKILEIDTKGNVLRELPPTKKAIAGQRLLLSLSAELQEYAEQLLIEHEQEREVRDKDGSLTLNSPWIKGGAIVAMDPKTGEVIALASYPRVDLNDFIPSKIHYEQNKKRAHLNKWLENETYIADIWDGKCLLERERYDAIAQSCYDEALSLTLEKYFSAILSDKSAALAAMKKISTINRALLLQHEMEQLLTASCQQDMRVLINALYAESPHRTTRVSIDKDALYKAATFLQKSESILKHNAHSYLSSICHNDDKLLVLDLCRMLVQKESFTSELAQKIGHLSLSDYRLLTQAAVQVQYFLRSCIKEQFHNSNFKQWRESNFKQYLSQKRKEERENKRYTHPYTEYLDAKEKEMFAEFWESHRWQLLQRFIFETNEPAWTFALENSLFSSIKDSISLLKHSLAALAPNDQVDFLKTMRSFAEMNRPLFGHYRSLRNTQGIQLEKHLAAAFYPLLGFGYGRSQAFRQATPLGSVFKLVVAYQALLEKYNTMREKNAQLTNINPLTIIDLNWQPGAYESIRNEQILAYTLEGAPITRLYKGGRLPRSHAVGTIDIVGAIEQSSNIYFAILAAEHIQDPLDLLKASRQLGFGEKTGIELPGEFAGMLPDDITHDRTGLYAFSIGQHSLVVTPLQTAVMMSAIANNGHVLKPTILRMIAGQERLRDYRDPFAVNAVYPFQGSLHLVGIDFSLFTSMQTENAHPHIWYSSPEVKRSLFLPEAIRLPLIEGMHRVISGAKGTARPEIIRSLRRNPLWKRNYTNSRNQLLGKTGTAEILFKQTLDVETDAKIHNHIWFGGILGNQELAIVVYLRFSEAGGKEAAPLAVEIAKKWQEICTKHGKSGF